MYYLLLMISIRLMFSDERSRCSLILDLMNFVINYDECLKLMTSSSSKECWNVLFDGCTEDVNSGIKKTLDILNRQMEERSTVKKLEHVLNFCATFFCGPSLPAENKRGQVWISAPDVEASKIMTRYV
ncbi:hypothetical protein HanRHA438_Chr12g0555591 [Helianthus annuus]|nr:hypothetical protein HanIR_Chr12g0586731 [Helianthus annuus]KAJ0866774.1 hypothetical protein HanRHA438_Chr12g0555591 [Helianthus annuus]